MAHKSKCTIDGKYVKSIHKPRIVKNNRQWNSGSECYLTWRNNERKNCLTSRTLSPSAQAVRGYTFKTTRKQWGASMSRQHARSASRQQHNCRSWQSQQSRPTPRRTAHLTVRVSACTAKLRSGYLPCKSSYHHSNTVRVKSVTRQ